MFNVRERKIAVKLHNFFKMTRVAYKISDLF